jgi:hypothetical protein
MITDPAVWFAESAHASDAIADAENELVSYTPTTLITGGSTDTDTVLFDRCPPTTTYTAIDDAPLASDTITLTARCAV